MFSVADLETMFNTMYRYAYSLSLYKFHMPSFNSSLVIAIRSEAQCAIHFMLSFHFRFYITK
jgi:hypothetical protein